jgi:hypothetical protein
MAFEMVDESFTVIVRRVGKGEIVRLSGVGSYYFIKTATLLYSKIKFHHLARKVTEGNKALVNADLCFISSTSLPRWHSCSINGIQFIIKVMHIVEI